MLRCYWPHLLPWCLTASLAQLVVLPLPASISFRLSLWYSVFVLFRGAWLNPYRNFYSHGSEECTWCSRKEEDALFGEEAGDNQEIPERHAVECDRERVWSKSFDDIGTILKQKEAIKAATPSKGMTVLSSKRSHVHDEMERLLLLWIKEKELAGDTIT